VSSKIDWLSRLLEMLNVHGQLDIRCFYGAPWRVEYEHSPVGEIPYHVILAGSAVLETPEGRRIQTLNQGDIVIVSHGSPHILKDGGDELAVPTKPLNQVNLAVSRNKGKGEKLDMLCGRFILPSPHDRLMRDYLPQWLVVRTDHDLNENGVSASDSQLIKLVKLMRSESTTGNLGGRAILNALSTSLFALTLRHASQSIEPPAGLLALAGHPRLAPALTALLNKPAHPWTLPELASLCNMSRATFVRHFQQSMGYTANELLTDIRMTCAVNELKNPGVSTDAVAEAVGYQSDAAFQRAFKQRIGVTPAQWRRSYQSENRAGIGVGAPH
jgi:AraC family transcriptional activator of mtrCDE